MSHELHRAAAGHATRRLARLNLAAALAFVVGGSLFALGAALAGTGAPLLTVNSVYLTGGVFFSLGGYTSIRLARRAVTGPRDPALRSAVVLFVGTLFFAVSLVAAFAAGLTPRQSDGWIWLPDITGCVCFLVSGQLALAVANAGGDTSARVRQAGWWVAAVNQAGSVLFFLAGLAAFVRPATAEVVNAQIVNWGTFAGAVCFAVAGVVQAFDTPQPTPTDEEPHP